MYLWVSCLWSDDHSSQLTCLGLTDQNSGLSPANLLRPQTPCRSLKNHTHAQQAEPDQTLLLFPGALHALLLCGPWFLEARPFLRGDPVQLSGCPEKRPSLGKSAQKSSLSSTSCLAAVPRHLLRATSLQPWASPRFLACTKPCICSFNFLKQSLQSPSHWPVAERMSESMSDRMSESMSDCQIVCQNLCQNRCQIGCQNLCQIECPILSQKECQVLCHIECQNCWI